MQKSYSTISYLPGEVCRDEGMASGASLQLHFCHIVERYTYAIQVQTSTTALKSGLVIWIM